MGIQQTAGQTMTNLPIPPAPTSPEAFSWGLGREISFRSIHPSVTYKLINVLRENLELKDEPVLRGTISWNPCENDENTGITGEIQYSIGYMLAAAILGDRKKFIEGQQKGYQMIVSWDFRRLDLFDGSEGREDVFVRCSMEDKFLHVYEMAEVAEHNLWGMILWPEWEKRNGFQQSLWKLLQEEYADSVDEYRFEMQRVLLNSVDSLYIQKYQEKAMNICRTLLPEMCADVQMNYWDKKNPLNPLMISGSGMWWEMNILDSWAKMDIIIENKIYPYLNMVCSVRTDMSVKEKIMAYSRYFLHEWVDGIMDQNSPGRALDKSDVFYTEKKWRIHGVTIEAWKNKIWTEDKISRHLERMERLEYGTKGNVENVPARILYSIKFLEKLMKSTEDEIDFVNTWKWEKYVYFISACWGKMDEEIDINKPEKMLAEVVTVKTMETCIREIKKKICEMDKEIPELKDKLLEFEMKEPGIDHTRLTEWLKKLIFFKNKLAPVGELTVDIKYMDSFLSLHYPVPLAADDVPPDLIEAGWESLPCASLESLGFSIAIAESCERCSGYIRKIWKMIKLNIEQENNLYEYQKRILYNCNEQDFLYAKSCGFFPDSVLEKAKLYAAEIGNIKVLPVLICLTAREYNK